MTFKLLSIASVAFGLAVGAAYAQTSTEADQTATSGRDIQNSEVVGPMYADKEMTKMRSKEEMKAAWDMLPEERHTKIKGECADPQNDHEKDFCDTIGDF
jgi:predicted NodU family carbamoyl transferase